jgi:hypothetical protein
VPHCLLCANVITAMCFLWPVGVLQPRLLDANVSEWSLGFISGKIYMRFMKDKTAVE